MVKVCQFSVNERKKVATSGRFKGSANRCCVFARLKRRPGPSFADRLRSRADECGRLLTK